MSSRSPCLAYTIGRPPGAPKGAGLAVEFPLPTTHGAAASKPLCRLLGTRGCRFALPRSYHFGDCHFYPFRRWSFSVYGRGSLQRWLHSRFSRTQHDGWGRNSGGG